MPLVMSFNANYTLVTSGGDKGEKMDRIILHSDCNCFYASVEMLYHPELSGKPLAVGGDPLARHGIVLTANYIAKKRGVKTGMALWQAKNACPDVIFVPPRMDLFFRFSRLARQIYLEYTDQVESFGCDEAWLAVEGSRAIKGDGMEIAREINRRIKHELGITVSIGVSWNKIFAKLGSDYKKPDAITEITRENYRSIVWPLKASDLLYVGRSTERKLARFGIKTIGDLANTDPGFLQSQLGKMGLVLHGFANGLDSSPVTKDGYLAPIKFIGNSTTTPRDLMNDTDVKIILMALSESVSARLRKNGFIAGVVEISVRDNGLFSFTRQVKLRRPTNITNEIMQAAYGLFREHYNWEHPIRSLGVRGSSLVADTAPIQMDLFTDENRRLKMEKLDRMTDEIRSRFGYFSIQRSFMKQDEKLSGLDAGTHTVHPVGYFHG